MGQLSEGVTSLLDPLDTEGGIIHGALYELNDPNGLEKMLQANPGSRNVILGNEQVAEDRHDPGDGRCGCGKPRGAEGGRRRRH